MAIAILSVSAYILSHLVLTSALPNVTPIQIGQGDCSAYPNSYFHTGDNADAFVFHPDQADDSSINGLLTGIWGTSLVVHENNTVDAPTIFCCDRGGTVLDPFGVQSLLLSPSDEELGYWNGIKPETYAHEVDGVRQDAVFLGMANVTTWAFKHAAAPATYYHFRLLVAGAENSNGTVLSDGEFKGFLKVVPPNPS